MVKGKASSTPKSVQVLRTMVASSVRSIGKPWTGVRVYSGDAPTAAPGGRPRHLVSDFGPHQDRLPKVRP